MAPSPADSPLAICYGTRPQVIKASVLIEALAPHWPLLTVDTGQHYDYELNALLYEQLGVRKPDVLLGVGSDSHDRQTAAVLTKAAVVLDEHRPWAAVVIGDTNSTLGATLAAAKLRIPVVHVEAGLRASDLLMAEEINRRAVDAVAAALCAPSRQAADRLRAERRDALIALTGDVARDVLERNLARLAGRSDGATDAFVLATLHRAELTDDLDALRSVLVGLSRLPLPVRLPVHPRTRGVLERHGLLSLIGANVSVTQPLGYLETIATIRAARVVVTDSGGVQREAYWLGTPCITLRRETEWTETLTCHANRLLAPSEAAAELPGLVAARASAGRGTWDQTAYGVGDAAVKIAEAISQLAARRR